MSLLNKVVIKKHNKNKHITTTLLVLSCICVVVNILTQTSYADDDDDFFAENTSQQQQFSQDDFFYKSNKAIFLFNSNLYQHIYIPIGHLYSKIPIEPIWIFKNFTQNYTETPKDIILSVLDFDIEALLMSSWRFLLNSFFGIAGVFDVAYNVDILSYHKTFEDILHFYNIPSGKFIVLPFFGATTITGLFSAVVDFVILSPWMWCFVVPQIGFVFTAHNFLNPFLFINYNTQSLIYVALGMNVGNYIYKTTQDASYIASKFDNTIDPYTAIKEEYLKQKQEQFAKYDKLRLQGQTNRDNICDYDGYVLLPEECEEDAKEYDFKIK